MKIQKINRRQLIRSSLLLAILFLNIYIGFSVNLINSNYDSDNLINVKNTENDKFCNESLKSSVLGNDTWWDTDFAYRRLITVTNPYDINFTDFGVSLILNYEELGSTIQSNLDDIRIIENNQLRKYTVSKDYPNIGFATIWFDTNITQSTTERDTYLYFGNSLAVNSEAKTVSDSFGWIKNGDFELDNSTDQYINPYGWTFSHDQVDQIKDISDPREASNYSLDSYNNFENNLVNINDREMAERVDSGYYAYKWGGEGSFLPQAACKDYVGTFYSYPFKVPIIEGGKIGLHVYRNVRTWFFEDPDSSLPTISNDGYFLRLCNGSDSEYTNEVDLHENIGSGYESWIETYGGFAYISPNRKTLRYHDELKEHFQLDPEIFTRSSTSSDGDLTGSLEIDVSNYMGKEIFIEFGTWGPEDGDIQTVKSGFFQVDNIKFNYTLSAQIEEPQAQVSSVEVVLKDIDGRSVPTANVMIVDNSYAKGSSNYYVANGTGINGRVTFNNIPIGYYNITANYTLGSQSIEVFNSIEKRIGPYYFNGIDYTIDINLNLWTIDFEIVDWDGIPLKYGYIEINESLGGALLDTLTLDSSGKATFRWLNSSNFYYRVYYNNDDYGINFSPTILNESSISRSDYVKDNVKFRHHTIYVNQSSIGSYSVSEKFYTDGSRTVLGNKKITKANITLNNMENYMTDISVYYIDKDDSTTGNLLYYKEYSGQVTSDFIELDIAEINNINLLNDNYKIYGLLVEVNGYNTSQSNGLINVNFIETCNVKVRTPLARLNIRLTYFSDVDKEYKPLSGTIKVIDNATGFHLLNLSAISDRDGYAYAPKNSYETPFWYLINRVYNFSIDVAHNPNVDFNITYINPSQWIPAPGEKIKWFNYTLYQNSSITFNVIPEVETNFTQYDTEFNSSFGMTEVIWGENLVFWAELLSTDDDWQTSDFVPQPPGSCILTIKLAGSDEVLKTLEMNYNGNGNYTLTYNSGLISAGNDWEYYNIEINGYHPIYDDPTPLVYLVKVLAKPTTISAHDYSSLNLIPSREYSAYFDEYINITVRYTETEFGTALTNALLSYEWVGLNPISIYSDPINHEYFTFTINTGDAQSTGLKVISITASFENYTKQSDFIVYLNILERKTTLNSKLDDLSYISSSVYVQDQRNFIFMYRDANTNNIIGDLAIHNFVWEELYENGTKVPGSFGSGSLIQNINHSYTLDFNTELKPVGYYFLYVTLKQDNYKQKNAFIYLEIILREFTVTIQDPQLGSNNQIIITQGSDIDFEIHLWDDTRSIELQNAIIKLNFRGINYTFNEILTEFGIYNASILTRNIDTFFTAQTFVGKIYIEAANFTNQEFTITITVKMQEIWPGMPTFYFILITSAIAAVVGSVVGYRVITRARIPQHVKKIRKIKGLIKSKKMIAESFTVPTKEQMMVKLFGDEWKEIGLSIEEALGITDIKKKSSLKDNKSLERGEID
ncbi:MAG: hypothetical protein ACFFAV_09000 [Candidatus Hermodarchaeota archaeon]